MVKRVNENDLLRKNREKFNNELKLFVNERLLKKKLISEDMYWAVKEILLRQSV